MKFSLTPKDELGTVELAAPGIIIWPAGHIPYTAYRSTGGVNGTDDARQLVVRINILDGQNVIIVDTPT